MYDHLFLPLQNHQLIHAVEQAVVPMPQTKWARSILADLVSAVDVHASLMSFALSSGVWLDRLIRPLPPGAALAAARRLQQSALNTGNDTLAANNLDALLAHEQKAVLAPLALLDEESAWMLSVAFDRAVDRVGRARRDVLITRWLPHWRDLWLAGDSGGTLLNISTAPSADRPQRAHSRTRLSLPAA
jgi:hypothetical protein